MCNLRFIEIIYDIAKVLDILFTQKLIYLLANSKSYVSLYNFMKQEILSKINENLTRYFAA